MTAAHHSCCPAARIALHARRLPSSTTDGDAYRWFVGHGNVTVVIYCPWCGVNLEAERRSLVRQGRPDLELRPRKS